MEEEKDEILESGGLNVNVVNNVCCFHLESDEGFPVHLNLSKFHQDFADVFPLKHDAKQFGSATIHVEYRSLGLKQIAVLIFSTGRIVCPGTSSEFSGLIYAHAIALTISRILEMPLKIAKFSVPNRVGKAMGPKTDPAAIHALLGAPMSKYDDETPDKFPAVFVRPEGTSSRIVYLFFKSGKIMITGCRSAEEMMIHQTKARIMAESFAALICEKEASGQHHLAILSGAREVVRRNV